MENSIEATIHVREQINARRLSRRFSKDYEGLPETAEVMTYGAMSRIMLRRLARAA